jgi:GNAT superfamily N-acetyltransferase
MSHCHIRPAVIEDLPSISSIHIEGWQTAYAQFLPQQYLDCLSVEQDLVDMQDWFLSSSPPYGFVAVQAGDMVGFVLAGPNEGDPAGYDAEVYKLFVRPIIQNRGIGKMLLANAVKLLLDQGFHRVAVWAFAEGSSARFYEHLGGKVVFETSQEPGGRETAILVFGWELEALEKLLNL